MAVKSKTLWVVLLAAGCAAIASGSPWGCRSDAQIEAEAHFDQGMSHLEKHELDAAIDRFTKAIELDPNLSKAYLRRGNAYDGKGEYDAVTAGDTVRIEHDGSRYPRVTGLQHVGGGGTASDSHRRDREAACRLDPRLFALLAAALILQGSDLSYDERDRQVTPLGEKLEEWLRR